MPTRKESSQSRSKIGRFYGLTEHYDVYPQSNFE
ncbi:protein of unknown function (plasmid) [Caballeronia sp. S22]